MTDSMAELQPLFLSVDTRTCSLRACMRACMCKCVMFWTVVSVLMCLVLQVADIIPTFLLTQSVFNMSKGEFAKLPSWRQTSLKKNAGLF